jgi:hypothetical protein
LGDHFTVRAALKFTAAMLLVFTLLTAVMTYPQPLHLADGVHDEGDPLMLTWVLAWIGHQLPHAPAHLFDANMFYPERRTLVYSETMLLPGIVAAPLHWLGVHPLLVYNLVFLSGFVVSGAGTALLVRSLTGSSGAGLIAGIVFAFLPFRIDHYAHAQLQQTQCLPLAMWAFHRLLRTERLRDGLLFGAFTAGQVLSCMYYGLFLIPYVAVVGGTLLIADRSRLDRRLPALAAAAVVATVTVLPLAMAYFEARTVVGERGRLEIENGSATWDAYLSPPEANLLYGRALARFRRPERQLFPGIVPIVLAGLALSFRPTSTVYAYALGLLLAFDVSLGFNGVSFPAFYEYVLPFRAVRIPARMGLYTGFSLAVLAGFGAARLVGRVNSLKSRLTVWIGIALALLVEYASRPVIVTVNREIPPVYDDLVRDRSDGPTATIFEFPTSLFDNPTYLYYSTFHWQHLVNGYSGFFPPSYWRVAEAVANFPDERSMLEIRRHGTNYLVIHGERLRGNRYETLVAALDSRADLKLVSRRPWFALGKHSTISVYRILHVTP